MNSEIFAGVYLKPKSAPSVLIDQIAGAVDSSDFKPLGLEFLFASSSAWILLHVPQEDPFWPQSPKWQKLIRESCAQFASEAVALTWYEACGGWLFYSHFLDGEKVREFRYDMEMHVGARKRVVDLGEKEPWEASNGEADALSLGALTTFFGIPGLDIVVDKTKSPSGASPRFRKDLFRSEAKQTKVLEVEAQERERRRKSDKIQKLMEDAIEDAKRNGGLTDDDPLGFVAKLMKKGRKKQ